jgi:hypothetical protein
LDDCDLPEFYPSKLENSLRPDVLEVLNIPTLSQIQHSYRWQPHLPFFPVDLEFDPWAARYRYKFHTLPIIQVGPASWTLDPGVAKTWKSHVDFFAPILRKWRGSLSYAPMNVNYVPDILSLDGLDRHFENEEKARRATWYYRTMIFCLFTEFAFTTSAMPNWRTLLSQHCKENSLYYDEEWVNVVENVLCDFKHTKRAGVIINPSTTELWALLNRYQTNGVPVLMEVGFVLFHDDDENPRRPDIHVVHPTPPRYHIYPSDWPTRSQIIEQTRQILNIHYEHRLGIPEVAPLSLTRPGRPRVEELGGDVHKRPPTTSWINPASQESYLDLQVAYPGPANARRVADYMGWIEFLDRRRESNMKRELTETPMDKQKREARLREAVKINKIDGGLPSKKSQVFRWVEEEAPVVSMHEYMGPIWKRVKVNRKEVEEFWDDYNPTQRLYDSFHNQWDLHRLFDYSPFPTQPEPEDENMDDGTHITNIHIAYLDQIRNAAVEDAYTGVQVLSSNIAFLSPQDLETCSFLTLGLKCSQPTQSPLLHRQTPHMLGCVVNDGNNNTPTYQYLQEFVHYIVKRQFQNPRLAELSDLRHTHPSYINLGDAGISINRVKVSSNFLGSSKPTTNRIGYILTPKHKNSSYNYGWILLVFEAITVVQVVRNSWGSSSMEDLVRHLVRHGIQFRTLVPRSEAVPEHIVKLNEAPIDFTALPPLKPNVRLTSDDYSKYVDLRKEIIKSPHGRAAFRMGGILWRLAMESEENFDDVISEIMDGPSELGASRGQYFVVEGFTYYDLLVVKDVADTICGMHGFKTGRNDTPGCTSFYLLFLGILFITIF